MQNGNQNETPQTITLEVSIDEANLVLEGLGHIPFARVYALVNKLQAQASGQLNAASPNGVTQKVEEAQTVLKA
ncbi:MAG: hypothetical protein ACE5F7_03600 [Nitrospiria bacterium]